MTVSRIPPNCNSRVYVHEPPACSDFEIIIWGLEVKFWGPCVPSTCCCWTLNSNYQDLSLCWRLVTVTCYPWISVFVFFLTWHSADHNLPSGRIICIGMADTVFAWFSSIGNTSVYLHTHVWSENKSRKWMMSWWCHALCMALLHFTLRHTLSQ